MISKFLLASCNLSSKPSWVHTFRTLNKELAVFMVYFQVESTLLNFFVSVGSYLAMSGESKMGWRYIHWPWHLAHSSSTSDMILSWLFHSIILSSKGFLKGLKSMAWVLTMCSSKSNYISSYPLIIKLVLYCKIWNFIKSHLPYISSSMVSIWYSFCAFSPISQISSDHFISPISKIFWKLKLSWSGSTLNPTLSEICRQCRSTIPYFLRATKSGTFGLNSSNYFFTSWEMLKIGVKDLSLKNRQVPFINLIESSTNLSAAIASI